MSTKQSFDDSYLNDSANSGHSTPKLSAPIDIPQATHTAEGGDRQGRRRRKTRRRAPSEDSSLSSHSSQSGDSPTTPPSASQSSLEEEASPMEATSPLLSYFLAHASPTKSAAHFSFKNRRKTVSGPSALIEDTEGDPPELPHVLHHARRLSSSWANAGTIGVQQKGPVTGSQHERHTSLMRRLSLGGNAQRPTFPIQPVAQQPSLSLVDPPIEHRSSTPRAIPRRSATIAHSHNHRAPSPMGERMLKGHFDGF